VQDRGGAEIPAEMAGIPGKGGERVGDRGEEQGVDHPGIALGERVQGVGQGEDEVEVLDGQQLGPARLEPPFLGEGLAFGAMPIAAGVVADLHRPTGVTGLPMPAQRGGVAGLDGAQGAALGAGQRVRLLIRRPMSADDVGQLHPRAPARARRRDGRRRRGHDYSGSKGPGRSKGEPVASRRPWVRWK
jgi:hypothetical protein